MADIKLPASGNITAWFGPLNGFANWRSPTVTEMAALMDISDAISWNDFGFGVQASASVSDPAITAKGSVQNRGAGNYGGTLSFYYPGAYGDTSNLYSLVYDAMRLPDTNGYIVLRVDGELLTSTTSTASNPGTLAQANDLVHVFKVTTGGYAESITGEEAFRYSPNFMSQGQFETYTVVRASAAAPTVAITPLTGSGTGTAKTKIVLNATVNSRRYTRGVKWVSSNPAVASVSANGIVTANSAGTANISATFPQTGTVSAAPAAITVS
jgi:hypothetical protein